MYKLILSASLLFPIANAYADMNAAKQLFDENDCTKCHSTEKFKYRKDKVNNFDKLHSTVAACANGTNVGWFEEEIEDVSSYLNQKYYHFKVKKGE